MNVPSTTSPTVVGALLTAGVAYPWRFYAFAGAAVVALLALLTVPAHPEN